MISSGLSVANHKTLMSLLASSHDMRIKVQVLDLNHNYLGDISTRLVDGQVDFDYDGAFTRSLKVVLLDPNFSLHLDSNSPDEGSLFMDRQIRIIYSVANPAGTFNADIPLFCGPIRKLDRNGALINVEAHSKEVILLPTLWWQKTYKKGMRLTSVMFSVIRDSGEIRLDIPARPQLLANNYSISTANTRWGVAKNIARALGTHLFYDGRGWAMNRPFPQLSVYTFTENVLTSVPKIGYDTSNLINAVEIIGGIPKGSKTRIHYRLIAPNSHPLSPWKLQRQGYPGYYPKRIQEDSITTQAAAAARARVELNNGLLQAVSVTFDSLPIPNLELGDVVRVETGEYNTAFRLTKMSIPLTARGKMSVGYNKRVTPSYAAVRRRQR